MIRERIANWLTGGEYARLGRKVSGMKETLQSSTNMCNDYAKMYTELLKDRDGLAKAHYDIIAMETKYPNATVKRMVARAKEALE